MTFDVNVSLSLFQIVSRYDIILILEVVDISGEAVKTFLDALNKLVLAVLSFKIIGCLFFKLVTFNVTYGKTH